TDPCRPPPRTRTRADDIALRSGRRLAAADRARRHGRVLDDDRHPPEQPRVEGQDGQRRETQLAPEPPLARPPPQRFGERAGLLTLARRAPAEIDADDVVA